MTALLQLSWLLSDTSGRKQEIFNNTFMSYTVSHRSQHQITKSGWRVIWFISQMHYGVFIIFFLTILRDSWMYPYQRTPMGNPYRIPREHNKYHGYTVRGTPDCPLKLVQRNNQLSWSSSSDFWTAAGPQLPGRGRRSRWACDWGEGGLAMAGWLVDTCWCYRNLRKICKGMVLLNQHEIWDICSLKYFPHQRCWAWFHHWEL